MRFKLMAQIIMCVSTLTYFVFLLCFVQIQSKMVDDSYLMTKVKRQTTYYLCGTFPNQYYSTTPCENEMCPNGGRYLNVGCTVSAQCTPYYSGTSTCINNCCCTVPSVPTTPPSSLRFGICPSGQLSEVRCSGRGQCASGQTCMTGLCCTTTGNEWDDACGGLAALSSCGTGGSCSSGVCTASNYCCECPVGRSAGACNSGLCPLGYSCNNGFCCPSCPNNVMPFGACQNGLCGGGRSCAAGNICC